MSHTNAGKNRENSMFIAIDLKSFYSAVECMERGLDPMTTNLVVADVGRTEKTICLAVTPSLKSFGISGRARLFEVVQKVRQANARRLYNLKKDNKNTEFVGKSSNIVELKNPALAIDYVVAPPRMAYYIKYSTRTYEVYLKYVAPEDIHVYSIDEVFIDVTNYLKTYKMTAHELAITMIRDVLKTTGITATAGIGTNLYLAKIAMDIVAKKMPADKDGVRIAELDEMTYREKLWAHTPITDFWRVGRGYATKLAKQGIFTMGDVARCSIGTGYYSEDLLYKIFGINAELLIDHAWGFEPCTIADIKSYKPQNKSVCSGQVLHEPYNYIDARLIVHEMLELMVLDLVDKKLVTDQIVLTIGYDIENIVNEYTGEVSTDNYGRKIPKPAHGTANICNNSGVNEYSSSTKRIVEAVLALYDRIINRNLSIRRISLSANHLINQDSVVKKISTEQLDFFTDYVELEKKRKAEEVELEKEKALQQTMLSIKKKFGKNAMLKGMNLMDKATARDRNKQIGGHKE